MSSIKIHLVSLTILFCLNGFCQTDPVIKIPKSKLSSVARESLQYGDQRKLQVQTFKIDIGYGIAKSFLLELPPSQGNSDPKFLRLASLVEENKFYFPFFITLDDSLNFLDIVKESIALTGGNSHQQLGQEYDIPIHEEVKYLLITTDPSLQGKRFDHLLESSNTTAIYSGSTVVYIPSSTIYRNQNILFGDDPQFKILVPTKSRNTPLKREKGIYLGFGVSFGGERVADNPSGDDYRAGGGAIFNLGYSSIIFHSDFVARYGLGFRYQGSRDGDARNIGFFGEASVTHQTKFINFGIGLHSDFGNSIRNLEGNEFDFKTSIGPKFLMEYRLEGIGNMGLEYLLMDYETKDGIEYGGNRLMITIKFFPSSW